MLIYQRVDTSQENGGLFTHQKSEICNRFALISYDFTRKNEELNIAQLAPELGIWWDLRDTDLVWEIPSMANSPAMAPAAKCPTRIIFLIFFASAFLSWNKREIGKSDFLETLDRPCFFFWGNYRGSCRFSIIDIYRPILGLVDHPWSSMIIRITKWTSTAGCIHLKWSGKSWWHGMKTSPIQGVLESRRESLPMVRWPRFLYFSICLLTWKTPNAKVSPAKLGDWTDWTVDYWKLSSPSVWRTRLHAAASSPSILSWPLSWFFLSLTLEPCSCDYCWSSQGAIDPFPTKVLLLCFPDIELILWPKKCKMALSLSLSSLFLPANACQQKSRKLGLPFFHCT